MKSINEKIIGIEEWGGWWRVEIENCYGRNIRKFSTQIEAQAYAEGKRLVYSAPTKGRRIKISGENKPEQFETWTERKTGSEILAESLVGYHFGFFGKTLAEVETCFFLNWPAEKTTVPAGAIRIEVPAGTKVDYYDDEFRVVLDSSMKAWKLTKGSLPYTLED
jgi:hypothetical protein